MKTCIFLIILFLSSQFQFAQEKHDVKLETDEVFNLPEVGALIVLFKNTFKIQFVAPENVRQAPYKNIDLRKDDIIMTVNGQNVKKIAEIKNAYNKLKIGQDFRLGIKRNKQTLLVNILKADPKNLPQKKSFSPFDQHSDNKVLLSGLGVVIINVNDKPMINKIFNKDNEEIKKAGLSEGNLLTFMNGQAIKTFSQFKTSWESFSAGQDINLWFDKTKTVSFKKRSE
jgi:PDZ domain-containing secreted protein